MRLCEAPIWHDKLALLREARPRLFQYHDSAVIRPPAGSYTPTTLSPEAFVAKVMACECIAVQSLRIGPGKQRLNAHVIASPDIDL